MSISQTVSTPLQSNFKLQDPSSPLRIFLLEAWNSSCISHCSLFNGTCSLKATTDNKIVIKRKKNLWGGGGGGFREASVNRPFSDLLLKKDNVQIQIILFCHTLWVFWISAVQDGEPHMAPSCRPLGWIIISPPIVKIHCIPWGMGERGGGAFQRETGKVSWTFLSCQQLITRYIPRHLHHSQNSS